MDCNSLQDLERLEEQVYFYKPNLKSAGQKQNVSDRLRNQLVDTKAVVRIQRLDAECERLMISLKQRLMLLQDFLISKDKVAQLARNKKDLKYKNEVICSLSSDSSDDEILSIKSLKQKEVNLSKLRLAQRDKQLKKCELLQVDTSESSDSYMPRALRRQPRERKLSYKSVSSSASTSQPKNKKLLNKPEHTVTTTGVTYHSEEMLMEEEAMDSTPTLHIKIPSLHRGNVHYIILDSLKFARKVFDYKANEIKEQKQQQSILHSSKICKTRKKQIKSISTNDPLLHQLTQPEQELELSQLLQDVMAEACNDETLQATTSLENINNNLMDNYDPDANENIVTYSQSSQELSFSQNSNVIDTVCSTSGGSNLPKKQRKNSKRSSVQHLREPPKKRGRKSKQKNVSEDMVIEPQVPTKSNLAKYVEFFANDCKLMPGSTTPAASSTKSQPLVSSTTQNFEHEEQTNIPSGVQQQQQQQPHQPITYYIDGDWANGGLCQLVTTNRMNIDARQLNQEDINAPFQDFINYIDNSSDSGNNVIARVLDGSNNSLPISIPLPIANLGLQNKNYQAPSRQIPQPPMPVINIQIPTLPNNIMATSVPPKAHSHNEEVLDLSVKSKSNSVTSSIISSNTIANGSNPVVAGLNTHEDVALPLDLSAKGTQTKEKLTDVNCNVTIDKQDEEFIRRLIEQSDLEYSEQNLEKNAVNLTLPPFDNDNNKSFKAALDMPLLDFVATDLAQLVPEDTTATSEKQQNNLTDEISYNASTNNEDSNYVSMSDTNSSIGINLHFSDQATTEIFNKLLNICPIDNTNNEFIATDDLNASAFDQYKVENSTMCESESQVKEKSHSELVPKDVCDTALPNELSVENEKNSSTNTSLAVQMDDFNKTNNSSNNLNESNHLKNESKTFEVLDNGNSKTTKSNKKDEIDVEAIDESNKKKKQVSDVSLTNSRKNTLKKDENFKSNNNNIDCNRNDTQEDKCSSSSQKNRNFSKNDDENVIENTDSMAESNSNNEELTKKSLTSIKKKYGNIVTKQYSNKSLKCAKVKSPSITKKSPNVVFSVAKITLSDDDVLDITDSDTFSEKSVDVSDKISNESNIQTNISPNLDNVHKDAEERCEKVGTSSSCNNKTSAAVLNQSITPECNKAENSLEDDVEMKTETKENNKHTNSCYSLDQKNEGTSSMGSVLIIENYDTEEVVNLSFSFNNNKENDRAEHIDFHNDIYVNDDIAKAGIEENKSQLTFSEEIQRLTPLELECKLEGSLDFDEDFDDALSLATSCFDSPNEDRFEDFVVEADNTQSGSPPTTAESNPASRKDLKHFKIPKRNTKTVTSKICANTEEKLENLVTVGKKTLPIIVENITRTVKNDLVPISNETSSQLEVKQDGPAYERQPPAAVNVLHKVFGITCLPYLVDQCFAITCCQLNHQLNDNAQVLQILNTLDTNQLNLAYKVLYNHAKLFKAYFPVLCTYYTTKNDRLKLLNMVNDCERYVDYGDFLMFIYESLVKCGLSPVNACRLMLKRIREMTTAATIIEALVAIIMKSSWTKFTDIIEKYTQEMYRFNFRIGTLEQMAPAVLNSKGPHLKQIFGKCVQTLHRDDTHLLLNSPNLIQCVALLTTNT